MESISQVLRVLARTLWPAYNERPHEVVGTVCGVLAALAMAVSIILDLSSGAVQIQAIEDHDAIVVDIPAVIADGGLDLPIVSEEVRP